MIKLGNQPVNFFDDPFDNPYIDEIKYKQLVNQGDITNFQFQTLSQAGGENVLTNPTFGYSLDGWFQLGYTMFTWNDGVLLYNHQGDNRLGANIQQYALVVGVQYEVRVNINRSVNGYWEFYLGTKRVAQKTVGTHTFSGVCEGNEIFTMKFIPTIQPASPSRIGIQNNLTTIEDSYSVGSIDYVYVTERTTNNHRFPIIDVEDGTVVDILESLDDPLNDPYTQSADANFYEKSLTMKLDWQTKGIANGCYRIGVCDADYNTNLQCGARNSQMSGGQTLEDGTKVLPLWTTATTGSGEIISVANNSVRLGCTTGTGSASIKQLGLKVGVTYDYKINISAITGTPNITVLFGSAGTTYTTTGIKTGQLTCATDTELEIGVVCNGIEDATIDWINIQAVDADLEVDYQSNPFWLATSHTRTTVVNCNNTENIFNFVYGASLFNPTLRLRGYLAPNDNAYSIERQSFENTFGNKSPYYFKRRRNRLLVVENEPEFIHDFLSLLGGYDHVMVNNIQYVTDDDEYPPVSWDYWRVIGGVQIPISEKIQLDKKIVTGVVKQAQFIEDADGNGVVGGFLTYADELGDIGILSADDNDTAIGIMEDGDWVGISTPISTTDDEFTQVTSGDGIANTNLDGQSGTGGTNDETESFGG
jgi:hypothetical protein